MEPMTGVAASRAWRQKCRSTLDLAIVFADPKEWNFIFRSLGREVAYMTSADIILIFIGIIGLLIAFGSFVVALLTFLDRD